MLKIDFDLKPADLQPAIDQMWELSGGKIKAIEAAHDVEKGAPVFTVEGKYTSQGWTEWTQGFQYGSALLQFDATDEAEFLETGRRKTLEVMAPHITHFGVHDHGFNNVSTYGNLWRMMVEGRTETNEWEKHFCELALKCSGAVQANRWSTTADGGGYIYSFNGPHSLFADTIRSLRALAMSHHLGHKMLGERDVEISLLERLVGHAESTAKYSVYYGKGRDTYDVRGRVAHESIFNRNDGSYRCANSQQGYSPFTTWTRGHAWIVTGYPEQLEFFETVDEHELEALGDRGDVENMMLEAALAAADFYIEQTPTDGIPYWDTGAPNLHKLGDYLDKPADPYNDFEPVDSTAAAIACQGLMRLGRYLDKNRIGDGEKYTQAGLTVLRRLLEEPYLSTKAAHQGLLLHSIYHRPNGWDHVPAGSKIPCGESSMWGDYHLREAALYVQRLAKGETYHTFFGPESK